MKYPGNEIIEFKNIGTFTPHETHLTICGRREIRNLFGIKRIVNCKVVIVGDMTRLKDNMGRDIDIVYKRKKK